MWPQMIPPPFKVNISTLVQNYTKVARKSNLAPRSTGSWVWKWFSKWQKKISANFSCIHSHTKCTCKVIGKKVSHFGLCKKYKSNTKCYLKCHLKFVFFIEETILLYFVWKLSSMPATLTLTSTKKSDFFKTIYYFVCVSFHHEANAPGCQIASRHLFWDGESGIYQ